MDSDPDPSPCPNPFGLFVSPGDHDQLLFAPSSPLPAWSPNLHRRLCVADACACASSFKGCFPGFSFLGRSRYRKSKIHDVFLSFNGRDVRRGFVNHLYHALSITSIGFRAFLDPHHLGQSGVERTSLQAYNRQSRRLAYSFPYSPQITQNMAEGRRVDDRYSSILHYDSWASFASGTIRQTICSESSGRYSAKTRLEQCFRLEKIRFYTDTKLIQIRSCNTKLIQIRSCKRLTAGLHTTAPPWPCPS